MSQGQGYNSYAGLGVQSVLGTTVARTKFWDFINESIQLKSQRKQWTAASETGDRINTEMGRYSQGAMQVCGSFEGLESLLKEAFGNGCLTTANITGSCYSQTYVRQDAMKSPGLSIEINRDVTAFLYEACHIEQIDFTQNNNDYLTIGFNFTGRDETQVSATSPTFTSNQESLKIHHAQLACTAGGSPVTLNSYKITMKNNLTGFRGQLGNPVTREIIRAGKVSVTGEISLTFEDVTRYNEFRNLTNVALVFTYTGPQITSGQFYIFRLTLNQINWNGDTPTVKGPGPIEFSMPFVALMSARATDDELGLYQENTISSVT